MDYFKSSKFDERVNELLKEWHAPGLAIAIIHNEKIESKGFGKASLESGKPVTPDTLFDIASSSKSLTAASVALLVADDDSYPQVKWDTPMSTLLPTEFVMSSNQYTQDVTVEDILSHRSGLPGHDFSYLGTRAKHPDDAESVTENVRNLPVSAPIRSKYMYCNLMFTVATYLVEKLNGISFTDFLHKHFFTPLRMESTHLQPSAAIAAGLKDRIANAYFWNEDEERYTEVPLQETPEDQGAGSIITSVNDYIKWVKALMNQEAPISHEVYKGLTKPRIISDPDLDPEEETPHVSPSLYAVGLETFHYRGHKVVQHDGLIAGFGSTHLFLPDLKFGVVVLYNSSSGGSATWTICQELMDEVIKVPESERLDWNKVERGREEKRKKKSAEEDAKWEVEGQPLEVALTKYTGAYTNAGYHEMTVEVRSDKLFIDATDRSFPATFDFDHLSGGTKFVAHLRDDYEGGDEKLEAEFQFEEEKVTRMGIKLEPEYDEFIWFDRT